MEAFLLVLIAVAVAAVAPLLVWTCVACGLYQTARHLYRARRERGESRG